MRGVPPAAGPGDGWTMTEWNRKAHDMDDPPQPSHEPWIGATDAWLLAEGRHLRPWQKLGAHPVRLGGRDGVAFAVWAPSARQVVLTGDFNRWSGQPMCLRPGCGVWELFVPDAVAGQWYKFEVHRADGSVVMKSDPYARQTELPPGNAARICEPLRPPPAAPDPCQRSSGPMAIYEVHAGSWRRPGGPDTLPGWDDLARDLVPYVAGMGFTHLELLPVSEHPFYGSWGYQPTGLYAPTARYGSPQDFRRFVDAVHAAGLKLILDWVPAHFPSDEHALARFDGTALYEHADPREGVHRDWNTLIYNFGRHEVKNFLVGNALFWIEQYGVDGLRVDAVASMLYRDYSRPPGEWIPNRHGGRENHEAIAFLQEVHEVLRREAPHAITIAEESTAFPRVTGPVGEGGLGFDHKWNMGWMHDTLAYLALDPVHRSWHHDRMTFSMMYAYSESYVLPLSHDEVVHGKGSLLAKMHGDRWQKLANLRALYGWMYAHPGRKLLFMGAELAQTTEWNHDRELPWELLEDPDHAGVQRLVGDLNRIYRETPALHAREADPHAFRWLVVDDASQSVLAFIRHGHSPEDTLLAIANFTPVVRSPYRVGVPHQGPWREVLNTDSSYYGGSNCGNHGTVHTRETAMHHQPWSLDLTLPPLSVLWLRPAQA
ncbi:MAG: 1,4-alpha-glucan branching protein GlgB [Burkholderiales bacterium]|nr:MAG: 1,4-alpha-glucan branching protein GlgB [Burkholderiales bacterium]